MNKMNWNKALEAMETGKAVSFEGWHNLHQHVFLVKERQVLKEDVKHMGDNILHIDRSDTLFIRKHLSMVDQDGFIVVGWLPNSSEHFSEDGWFVVE